MKHKTLVKIAIVMAIVFGTIVVVYPTLFGPSSKTPVEATPAVAP
jgi:hypothetical protein